MLALQEQSLRHAASRTLLFSVFLAAGYKLVGLARPEPILQHLLPAGNSPRKHSDTACFGVFQVNLL